MKTKRTREPTEAECGLFLAQMGFTVVNAKTGKKATISELKAEVARETKRRNKRRAKR